MAEMQLTPNAMNVLKKQKYLHPKDDGGTESVQEMWSRVSVAVGAAEDIFVGESNSANRYTFEKEAYYYQSEGLFVANSPTMVNAGKKRGQLAACFVLPIEDDTHSIMQASHNQVMVQTSGGGTGFSGARLRCRNSLVGTTGKVSGGAMSVLRMLNANSQYFITQGAARNGANMWVQPCWHFDVLEFIDIKRYELRNLHHKLEAGIHLTDDERKFLEGGTDIKEFNISVAATDEFMELATNGDYTTENWPLKDPKDGRVVEWTNAASMLDRIIFRAWSNGEPGLLFIDAANRQNPTPQIGTLEATNPCLTGDTFIATDKGLLQLHDIVEHKLKVKVYGSDGQLQDIAKYVDSGVQKIFQIKTRSGAELYATSYHRWPTKDGEKQTHELQVGDKLSVFVNAKLEQNLNTEEYDAGLLLGWLIGDGYLSHMESKSRSAGIIVGKDDFDYIPLIQNLIEKATGQKASEHKRDEFSTVQLLSQRIWKWAVNDMGVIPHKAGDKEVPQCVMEGSQSMQRGFLKGLFSADGHVVHGNDSRVQVRLTSKSKALMDGVRILLTQVGVVSKVMDRSRPPREDLFKHVNKDGDTVWYGSDGVAYEVHVSGRSYLEQFARAVGFTQQTKTIKLTAAIESLTGRQMVDDSDPIISIEPAGVEHTYCLNVTPTHSMVANGINTLNCGEQWLLGDESCTLGHAVLSRFCREFLSDKKMPTTLAEVLPFIDLDKLRDCFKFITRFLDNVVQVNYYPVESIAKMHRDGNRKIGVGVLGWGDMLAKLHIRYGSELSLILAAHIGKLWQEATDEASIGLAKERGSFGNYKGSAVELQFPEGMRNACRRTVAPTGSTGIIVNASTGIEPIFGLVLTRNQAGSIMHEVHSFFQEVLDREVSKSYHEQIFNYFSVMKTLAGISKDKTFAGIVPEWIEQVFVQASDVSPTEHVAMQAAWQQHTDNSISKTINMPSSASENDVRTAYVQAWKSGCKGITVYRDGSRNNQVLTVGDKTNGVKKTNGVNGHKNGHSEQLQLPIEMPHPAVIESVMTKAPEVVSFSSTAHFQAFSTDLLAKAASPWASSKKKLEQCPNCSSKNIDHGAGCATCADCGGSFC